MKIVRHIIFSLFMLCHGLTTFAQGSWEQLTVPTGNHLRSVYFTDSLYGWVVGDTGTILHTRDGGQSWIMQDAGMENNIMHVFFLDRQMGWAAAWNYQGFFGTIILKTTDGGDTWAGEPYPHDNIFINCILFLDSLKGWMGGSPHALVHTSDGGQNWFQAAIDTNALAFFPVLNIAFYDENYGYACGGMFDIAGVTWSTSDGGAYWSPIDNADAPADEVHGLHLFDSLTVLGAGGDPDQGYGVGMIRTADGGQNWDYEELSMAGNAFDIDFRNATEAWAPLGPVQKMIFSMDAGNTWIQLSSPNSTAIFDMTFPDSLHGYGVGYNGAFIRYIPEPVLVQENHDQEIVSILIYPNPADRSVTMSYTCNMKHIDEWEQGYWILYNSYGKVVKFAGTDQISSGTNTLTMDVSMLPAGLYFSKLILPGQSNTLSHAEKLILR